MAPRDGWLARQIDKITAQEPSMRMALRFTNGGGRGMTEERLCGWLDCGLPEDHPHHRDRGQFEWHPFEAAPSTDEGEARQVADITHNADLGGSWWEYRLPHWTTRRATTFVPSQVEAAIRAPLERDLEIARMYAAGVEGTLEQVRTENRAAEERIRELEAIASHTDGVMHIATERITELEAESSRLREALERSVRNYHAVWCASLPGPMALDWRECVSPECAIVRALATPPSSTEGTKEVDG